MKKLLFIIMCIITFSSCTEQTFKKADIPIEVVTLKEAQKFDTILSIQTGKSIYQFTQKQEYIGKAYKEQKTGGLILFGLLFGIGITFIIVGIFTN